MRRSRNVIARNAIARNVIAALTTIAVMATQAPALGAATTAPTTVTTGAAGATITVDGAADSGPGSLRAAILAANARPGAETIVVTAREAITLASPLPAITDALAIVGESGAEIRGAGSGAGLVVNASDVMLTGLIVRRFDTAIRVERASRVTITKNTIADNRGAGIDIVGPSKDDVAALLASGALSLEQLMAVVPTDIVVRENAIGRNGGPAVTRTQDGILRVTSLTSDGSSARGTVGDAGENATVELFSSSECDDTRPQGERPLGTAPVGRDGTFTFKIAKGQGAITAIATDDTSGSSAVSACAQLTAPNASAAATTTVPDAPLSLLAAAVVPACTITFDGSGGSSSWPTASNWNTNVVPAASDVVCIPDGFDVVYGTGTSSVSTLLVDGALTISGGSLSVANASTVSKLSVTGGTLSVGGALSITGAFTWSSGTLAGAGTLTIADGVSAVMTGVNTKILSLKVVNEGTLEWSGGVLQMRSDLGGIGELDNQATFNISVVDNIAQWCCGTIQPRFKNNGTIHKTGTGQLTLDNLQTTNTGTIDIQQGKLRLTNGTIPQTLAGTISGTNGTLEFVNGNWTLTGTVTVGAFDVLAGAVTVTNTAHYTANTTRSSGGTFTINSTDANTVVHALTVSAGTLGGTTNLTPDTSFAWSGGALGGAGTLTLPAGIPATMTGVNTMSLSRRLVNNTTLNWSAGFLQMRSDLGGIGELDNQATFNISVVDNIAQWCCGTIQPRFKNNGTIHKTGTGQLTLDNLQTTNTGTIDIQQGKLRLTNGTIPQTLAGTISGTNGTLEFVNGNWTLTGTVTVGAFDVLAGAVTVTNTAHYTANTTRSSGGTFTINSTDANTVVHALTVSAGTLGGTTNLTPDTSFAWSGGALGGAGTLTLPAGIPATMTGVNTMSLSRRLVNNTTLNWSAGFLQMRSDLGGIGELDNQATFNISVVDNIAQWCCGTIQPRFKNNGTIHKTGTGQLTLDNLQTTNTGTIDVRAGTLLLAGAVNELAGTTLTGGTWRVANGATLKINSVNVVTNQAVVALEGPTAAFVNQTGASALRNLALNSGTIELGAGAQLQVNPTFQQNANGRFITTLGPAGPGRLVLTGNAALNGTLTSVLQPGFTPASGLRFTVIDAGSFSGGFATVDGALSVFYDAANGNVDVGAQPVGATLSVGPDVVAAEDSGAAQVLVQLDQALPFDVGVPYSLVTGSANAGDFDTTGGTAIIASGDLSATISVPLTDDTAVETDETFTVEISDPILDFVTLGTASATVTIDDDDVATPPLPFVTVASFPEGGDSTLITVTGMGGTVPITLPVTYTDVSASSPADYATFVTTVIVPPNASTVFSVNLVDDLLDEDDETFIVNVGGSGAEITIVDDDPTPTATIDDVTVVEGNSGAQSAVFPVHLSEVSGREVRVLVNTHDGTAIDGEDYTGTTTLVTIPAGASSGMALVPVLGDTIEEGGEEFTVTLLPSANAFVAEDEGATGTIVDDDTPAGTGDIPNQLRDGSTATFAAVAGWGEAFDLDGFGSGAGTFELPVVTDDLAQLFGTGGHAAALDNPLDGVTGSLDDFLTELEDSGIVVDWVEGGIGGRPVPPTEPDIVQLRYVTTLADLAEAIGFDGDGFNDDMSGVLDGLAGALGLDATLVATADLEVTLVFGIDETGFYVSNESGLRLDIDATAAVHGAGDVAGVSGLAVDGTGSAHLGVTLRANRGPARLRADDLAADPHTYLRPIADGTASLDLETELDPLTASWSSTHTLTATGNDTQITTAATLDATLTLADFTVETSAGATPAALALHGTFDGTTWQLHGEGDVAGNYAIDGFTIEDLSVDATVTPNTFSGAFDGTLHVNLGSPDVPVVVDLHATYDHAALHAAAHADVDDQTFGSDPALVFLDGTSVDVTLDSNFATATTAVEVTVHADTLVLLPEPLPEGAAAGTIPDGAATATGIDGQVDAAGNVSLHADTVNGAIAGSVEFSLADVDFSLGPDAIGPVFSVASATATIPDLGDLVVTLTGFHLNRDGTFGATAIDVEPGALAAELGLAGVLPFDITGLTVTFPDHENLDQFLVAVEGRFDFEAMSGLPFDPVIGIGGDAVTPDSPAAANNFTFTIAVDSLSQGAIAPEDFGPITLGFDDLAIGDVTISAALTLGGYENGDWVDDFGGTITIGGTLGVTAGAATIDVGGSVDPDAGSLSLAGTFAISATLGDDVEIIGASLGFALGLEYDGSLTVSGPTLTGAGIDEFAAHFGDFMTLTAHDVTVDFNPPPGEPIVTFGGTLGDGALGVEFDDGAAALAGWGGNAGNFAIGADLQPKLLPGFFVDITVPDGEQFGLPDFLPLRLDEIGVRFPNIDLANLPPEGVTLDDLTNFAVRFSGGIEATNEWPISASVDGLEFDLGLLVDGQFPITNLDGFKLGVEPFELAPGFTIGGGLELGTVDVDGDSDEGVQPAHVFYGRLFGTFEFEGIGAGIDLVVSEYGPVLAQVQVPLGIPIDGGLLGGVILASVKGGVKFGGNAFPDPDSPLEILHDDAFDTDFPVDDGTIAAAVEHAVQLHTLTWDDGFTLALSGTILHALAPGVVTGEVTLGANIGLIPGQQGLKLIGSGDLSIFGMPFAGAAMLIDLHDALEPKFDLAFETPQTGNPLGFLLPAQQEFEVSVDTKGMAAGFGLAVRTFLDRVVHDGLAVGQDLFDAALDELAATLEADHSRPLARVLLDGGPGPITRTTLVNGVLARLALGGNGLPADPAGANAVARAFVQELLDSAGALVDDFDLSGVFTDPDNATFAALLGEGGEAIAAMLGVLRDAVLAAGDAFLSQFDPSFHLRGAIQPVILGIPFGEPEHEVEVIVSKDGLGFGFDTSFGDISKKISNSVFPFIGGAALSAMSLGFEDSLGMTFELPIGGIVDGLFGGDGFPTIDPLSGDWAIELRGGLKFLDFEVGQMTGLVIAPHNQGFLDTHVQKLFEPHTTIDPGRIPIQTPEHYQALLDDGGILLTGRMLLPELLTDPVGLLKTLDLQVPVDPFQLPAWIASIADHLSRIVQPASVQAFIPGYGAILDTDFDAPTEAGRIGFNLTGQALADAVNGIFEDAYLEGTYDGSLLSVPMGEARVEVSGTHVAVHGEIPLIGLDGTFLLDRNDTQGTNGVVSLPRAAAEVTIDPTDVEDVLARFGIPPLVSPVAGAGMKFRMYSPAYDPTSSDPLLQHGGTELLGRLQIAGVVNNAEFRIGVTPDGVHADASVGSFQPFPGLTLTGAHVGFDTTRTGFAGSLSGQATLPPWLAAFTGVATTAVNGGFDTNGKITATVTISGQTFDLVTLFQAGIDKIVDVLRQLGATFVQIADILFRTVTNNVTTIVDQLARKGATFIQMAEAIFLKVTNNVTTIVDQLVRKGATFIQMAEAVFLKVTNNVVTIVDQLFRKGATFIQMAEALFLKVTTDPTVIVDQLVRKGASFIQMAEAVFLKVTNNVITIVDQLFRKGATFIQMAEALFLKVTTNPTTIVDQLVRKGATFIQMAEAIFLKVTNNVITIVDQLFRKGATFIQMAEALFLKVTTNVTTIVDQLFRKGASFVQLAEAIFKKVTTNVTVIVNHLVRKGADHLELADALFKKVTTVVSTIVDQVFRMFPSFFKLAESLLKRVTTDVGTIVDELERKGASFRQIASAFKVLGKTYRQITDALDDFTTASFNSIAAALGNAGATFAQIVDALDVSTTAGLNAIADAVRFAGASFREVMAALEAELNVSRYDTAAQLNRLGASINSIIAALVNVYNAGLDSIIDVLVTAVGIGLASATAAACSFLGLC